jgi:hypothetical protein
MLLTVTVEPIPLHWYYGCRLAASTGEPLDVLTEPTTANLSFIQPIHRGHQT